MRYLFEASSSDFCQRPLLCPLLLTTAVFFSNVFYSSYATRVITFIALVWFNVSAFNYVETPVVALSYISQMCSVLMSIRAFVLLIVNDPPRDFKRIRRIEDQTSDKDGKTVSYSWEGIPPEYSWRRFHWATELAWNLQLTGWNCTKPPSHLPTEISLLYASVSQNGSSSKSKSKTLKPIPKEPLTRSAFILQRTLLLLLNYVIVDIVIFFADIDHPFFQGTAKAEYNSIQAILKTQFRFLLGGVGILGVIEMHYHVTCLLAVGLFGPKLLGTLGEPWFYPLLYGPISSVYHKGLIGFWSSFWHPLFKNGFQSTANFIFPDPPENRTSATSLTFRAVLRLHVVFALSGLLHAAGTARLPNTHPWLSFASFMLQAPGIILQEILRVLLRRFGVPRDGVVEKVLVLVFDFAWSTISFPLLIGDMASAGLWKTEVLPYKFVGRGVKWYEMS